MILDKNRKTGERKIIKKIFINLITFSMVLLTYQNFAMANINSEKSMLKNNISLIQDKTIQEKAYNALIKADKITEDFEEDCGGTLDFTPIMSAKYSYSKTSDCSVLQLSEMLDSDTTFYVNNLHDPKNISAYSVKGKTETKMKNQGEIEDYFDFIIDNSFLDIDADLLKKIVYCSKITNDKSKLTIETDKLPDNLKGELAKELQIHSKPTNIKIMIEINNGKLESYRVTYDEVDEDESRITDTTTMYYKITYKKQNIKEYKPIGNKLAADPFTTNIYKLDTKQEAIVSKKASGIIAKIIKPSMSTQLEKFMSIYDYLFKNTKYDYLDYAKNEGKNCNEYELLINGYGLDYSYAQALKRLCNLVGIECEAVTGHNSSGHAIWNAVKLDGKWNYCNIVFDKLKQEKEDVQDILFGKERKYIPDKVRSDGKAQNYDNLISKIDLLSNTNKLALSYINGYIYYVSLNWNSVVPYNAIGKCRLDGSGATVLYNDFSSYWCSDKYIYCSRNIKDVDKSGTYKINADNGSITKISGKSIKIAAVYNGWIYYQQLDEEDGYYNQLYRMRCDGTGDSLVSSRNFISISTYNGCLYLSDRDDNSKYHVYKMSMDGSNEKLLYNGFATPVDYKNNKLVLLNLVSIFNQYVITIDNNGKVLENYVYSTN